MKGAVCNRFLLSWQNFTYAHLLYAQQGIISWKEKIFVVQDGGPVHIQKTIMTISDTFDGIV